MDVKKIKEQLDKVESNRSFTDPYKRLALKVGETLVRMVGEWESCKRAWITCDDETNRPFIIGEDSILQEILDHVMAYEVKRDSRTKKNFRKYTHRDKQAFKIVAHNGSENEQDKGWRPSTRYLFNVLDRETGVAAKMKHTLLLAKNEKEIGVGEKAFEKFAKVVGKEGDPSPSAGQEEKGEACGYDLVFMKVGTGMDTDYDCRKAESGDEGVVEGPLTAKERSFETYDLKEVGAPTSAETILDNLEQQITLIDEELGTDFLARLKGQCKEKPVSRIEEMRARLKGKVEKDEEEEEKPIAKKLKKPVKPVVAEEEEEEAGVEEAESVPVRKKVSKGEVPKMSACPDCGTKFPASETKCPGCGAEFE